MKKFTWALTGLFTAFLAAKLLYFAKDLIDNMTLGYSRPDYEPPSLTRWLRFSR